MSSYTVAHTIVASNVARNLLFPFKQCNATFEFDFSERVRNSIFFNCEFDISIIEFLKSFRCIGNGMLRDISRLRNIIVRISGVE